MIHEQKEHLDIIGEDRFREETLAYLKNGLNLQDLSVPNPLPNLYKYRNLSNYAVDDIINNRFTATSIGSFNDIYDGAIQVFGSREVRKNLAQADWEKLDELGQQCGLQGILPQDSYVTVKETYYTKESRNKFHIAENFGTHVFCLSEKNDSILMWAHYANENTGVCIEYDFNNLSTDSLIRRSLFPVVYSSSPIDVLPLIGENANPKELYPVDTAIFCAALNKADVWKYENEWRYVEVNGNEQAQRIYKEAVKPNRIIFGNRFLKPLFYFENGSIEKQKECVDHYDRIMQLLDYMIQENIMAAIQSRRIGSFKLEPINVLASSLKKYLMHLFREQFKGEKMQYYYFFADPLFNWLEEGAPIDAFSDNARFKQVVMP